MVDTSGLRGVSLGDTVQATLRGYWGFEPYRGPTFVLRNARAASWQLAAGDESALIVGRQDTVHLRADSVELRGQHHAQGSGRQGAQDRMEETQAR